MLKLIAAINMTLDGFCNHDAIIPDDEMHQHYNDLMNDAGTFIYGRVTYQMMENYWPAIVKNPTGNKPTDEFALLMDNIPKIVYSRTLKQVDWKNSELKNEINKDEILELKKQDGKDIYVGSPSLIRALTNLGLVDELQLCVHPVILGNGLPLFKNIEGRIDLTLIKTKAFNCGAVIFYYQPK